MSRNACGGIKVNGSFSYVSGYLGLHQGSILNRLLYITVLEKVYIWKRDQKIQKSCFMLIFDY